MPKNCLYCGMPSNTRDHVPPKVFLERPYPSNLKTVPTCAVCNNGFSLDEEYLAVFLANIISHPAIDAGISENGRFDRALMNSEALDQRLINSLRVEQDGNVSIEPELTRISAVVCKIAFGLYCLRYGASRPISDFRTCWISATDHVIPLSLKSVLSTGKQVRQKRWQVVQESVFEYLFVRDSIRTTGKGLCFILFFESFLAVVECPALTGNAAERKGSRPTA
jgi:hypothetical protein